MLRNKDIATVLYLPFSEQQAAIWSHSSMMTRKKKDDDDDDLLQWKKERKIISKIPLLKGESFHEY